MLSVFLKPFFKVVVAGVAFVVWTEMWRRNAHARSDNLDCHTL